MMQLPWQLPDWHKNRVKAQAEHMITWLTCLQENCKICSTGNSRRIRDNYHFQRVFSKLMPEVLQELSERLFGQ